MPSVVTPKEFFQKEKANLYAGWRRAFWRELLSNSVDAEASEIHISADWTSKAGDPERVKVTFEDNGSGMSEETIRDVYMQLGRSTKDGDDGSVGGFGRARILTCFGQDSYEIHTRDILVKGEGGSYEIEKADSFYEGTKLTIHVDDNSPRRLLRALPETLAQSSLLSRVHLRFPTHDPDGFELDAFRSVSMPDPDENGFRRFKDWTRKGKEFGQMADDKGVWGHLFVNKGAKAAKGHAIIRVNGMSMYDDTIAADAQVTIDLVPERAKEIMTVSRDAIRSEYRGEFSKLFAKIVADQSSTFRQKSAEPIRKITKGRHTAAKSIRSPETISDKAIPVADLASIRDMNHSRRPDYAIRTSPDAAAPAVPEAEPKMHDIRHEVAIFIDKPTPAQLRASRRFQPEVWGGPGGTGAQAELLHAAWTAACGHVLEKLAKIHPGVIGETWTTGFVFDENMAACHTRIGGTDHALLLNPLTSEGTAAFKLSDSDSVHQLVQLAIHEVAHCVHDWHDEHYANLQTRLAGEVRERGYTQAIKAELKECLQFQRERLALQLKAEDNTKCEPHQHEMSF